MDRLKLLLLVRITWLQLLWVVVWKVIGVQLRCLSTIWCKGLAGIWLCQVKWLFCEGPLFFGRWQNGGWCLRTFVDFVLFFKFSNFHLHKSLLFRVYILAVRAIWVIVERYSLVGTVSFRWNYVAVGKCKRFKRFIEWIFIRCAAWLCLISSYQFLIGLFFENNSRRSKLKLLFLLKWVCNGVTYRDEGFRECGSNPCV